MTGEDDQFLEELMGQNIYFIEDIQLSPKQWLEILKNLHLNPSTSEQYDLYDKIVQEFDHMGTPLGLINMDEPILQELISWKSFWYRLFPFDISKFGKDFWFDISKLDLLDMRSQYPHLLNIAIMFSKGKVYRDKEIEEVSKVFNKYLNQKIL